jgi:hypothetical protein
MERTRERGLRDDVGTGFSTSATLFRELLQHDREATALVAVLSTRVDQAVRDLEHLRDTHEDVVLLRQAVESLEQWRTTRDALAGELMHVKRAVEELAKHPSSDPETTRGKWTTLGLIITTAGSLGLGLINLLK